ncbi:hypothetical protein N9L47_09445 [Rhodobacteraceae bacterium]|nr:hypothetical protein [Paracoccaceae bacterium]
MFFRDIKPKRGNTMKVTLADAHLPVKMGNRDAELVFGAPLQAQLAATNLGTVISCDTRKRASGAAIGVDIALGLTNGSEATLRSVASLLEVLSAPCGSSVRLSEGVGIPMIFGVTEGLEVAIDTPATTTPGARHDLTKTCTGALKDTGVCRGWDQRQDTTVFYFYGESYADMRERLTRALSATTEFCDATIQRMA